MHLQAGVLASVMIRPGPGQLAVREDVAVEERADAWRPVVRPGDAVVEQPAPRAEPVAQEREVRRVVADADVLGQADRADRVEAGLRARRGSRGDAPRRGRRAPPASIASFAHSPAACDSVTPSAWTPYSRAACRTMPPQPQPTSSSRWPGCRSSLRATRSYFSACASSRVASRVGVDGAGVGHRGPEHQLVEAVGDVVVVGDHLGVARHRVPQPLDHPAPPRQRLLRRGRRRPEVAQADARTIVSASAGVGARNRRLFMQQAISS